MFDTRQAEKTQMISALQSHQVNTVAELRRIEKVFAQLGSSDVAAPMTAACV
jgi:ferritin-like metal-binding protein YciE